MRINLSQAFNGVGSVVAPLLGSYFFFKDVGDSTASLRNVQWVYLAIACFVVLLALVLCFSDIPEITDADMAYQVEAVSADSDKQPFRKQYRLFHAAFAQFCYCGAQVAIAGYFINYVTETRPNTSSSLGAQFLAGAQGAFAVGRFLGVGLMKFCKPRHVFLAYFTLIIIFLAPAITQRGNIGVSMLFLTLFFESIIFPTIVALGMKGLGRHSKRGSGVIVGGVVGGAVVPPMLGAVSDAPGSSTATVMSIPLAFFVLAWTYPLCINFVASYRDVADQAGADLPAAGVGVIEEVQGGYSSQKDGNDATKIEESTRMEKV